MKPVKFVEARKLSLNLVKRKEGFLDERVNTFGQIEVREVDVLKLC